MPRPPEPHRPSPGPAALRWGGFGGVVLMAAGAWFAGAWVEQSDQPWRIPGIVLWFTGLALLAAAWWPLATRPGYAAPAAPGPAVSGRWLTVTGLLWAVPLLLAPVVGSRDVYSYACQGASWLDGADPYAGGGTCRWRDAVASDWQDAPAPYGGTALLLSGAVIALARLLPLSEHGTLVAAVTLFRLLAVGAAVVAAAGLRRLALGRSAVALGVLTPLAAVHLVGGAHHDALIAGLLVGAFAAAATARGADAGGRGRAAAPKDGATDPKDRATADGGETPGGRAALTPLALIVLAGTLVGLAAAIKVTAVVALPFVALLALRPATGSRDLSRLTGRAATVAGAAVTAVAVVSLPFGWGWLGALQGTQSMVQWTSVPTAAGMAVGYVLRALGHPEGYAAAVAVTRAVGVVLLAAAGAALVWRAARRYADPRAVLRCAGWMLAAVAVLSPVFYPWYALPALAVLAATGVRVAAATVGLALLVLPDGLGLAVRTKLPGAFLVVIAVCVLGARAAGSRRRRAARVAPRDDPATPRSTG